MIDEAVEEVEPLVGTAPCGTRRATSGSVSSFDESNIPVLQFSPSGSLIQRGGKLSHVTLTERGGASGQTRRRPDHRAADLAPSAPGYASPQAR